jgi:predicted membrane channel-forming protein YqfA (hemolysin III family)
MVVFDSLDNTSEKPNNQNKRWFKNKEYGYGWTPNSSEGWLVLLVFVIFLIVQIFDLTQKLETGMNSMLSAAIYIFNFIFALTVMLTITTLTGEKPKWSWRNKK